MIASPQELAPSPKLEKYKAIKIKMFKKIILLKFKILI